MKTLQHPGLASMLLATALLLPSCNYRYDTVIPFVIKERYDVSRDRRTESWADFVSGC